MAVLMLTAGEVEELRTMLTSLCACSSQRSQERTKYSPGTSDGGTTSPARLVMMSLMQGGGVMGRRSLSPKPHMRARAGCCSMESSKWYVPLVLLKDNCFSCAWAGGPTGAPC